MYVFEDEYGTIWETRYVVTQTEAEGPEYVEYRKFADDNGEWIKLPPWALPPRAMMEHFHGPIIEHLDPTHTVLWESPDGMIYQFRLRSERIGVEFQYVGDINDLKLPGKDGDWDEWRELPADQGDPPKEVMVALGLLGRSCEHCGNPV